MNCKVDVKCIAGANAHIPIYATEGAAAADLYACMSDGETEVTIPPGSTKLISTGIAMAIPVGCVGLIYARSGLAVKKGLCLANGVGVIDSDYRGMVMVALMNTSNEPVVINHHDRIAQMMIVQFITADYKCVNDIGLTVTARDTGGFGSTGVREEITNAISDRMDELDFES